MAPLVAVVVVVVSHLCSARIRCYFPVELRIPQLRHRHSVCRADQIGGFRFETGEEPPSSNVELSRSLPRVIHSAPRNIPSMAKARVAEWLVSDLAERKDAEYS